MSRLTTAFSRTQPDKVYVQHRMLELATQLQPLLALPHCHVFVCGDGGGMATGVQAALCSVLGAGDAAVGAAALAVMTREGRYVRDIWS